MKNLLEIINEEFNDSDAVQVVCVKEYKTKYHTFQSGEKCEARKINNKWWIIEAIGIPSKAFKNCFKKNPS